MRFLLFLGISMSISGLVFVGCASKPVYKVQVKEVMVPVKCNLKLPDKPINENTFESHRQIMIYYRKVEQIAKDCTKEN